MNPEFEQIGKAFVGAYYQLFQTDRSQLVSFYQEDSLMTYEGSQAQGLAGIAEKFSVGGQELTMRSEICWAIKTTIGIGLGTEFQTRPRGPLGEMRRETPRGAGWLFQEQVYGWCSFSLSLSLTLSLSLSSPLSLFLLIHS